MNDDYWVRKARHHKRMAILRVIQLILVVVLITVHIYRACNP